MWICGYLFDFHHKALVANRTLPQREAGQLFNLIAVVVRVLRSGEVCGVYRMSQQLAAESELMLTKTVAEKPVVTNTLESIWKNVHEKPPDELFSREGHRFVVLFVAIILPAETHNTIFDINQSVVGDGDTVSIAAQVIQHLLRPRKRLFCIDDPFYFSHGRKIALELVWMLKPFHR